MFNPRCLYHSPYLLGSHINLLKYESATEFYTVFPVFSVMEISNIACVSHCTVISLVCCLFHVKCVYCPSMFLCCRENSKLATLGFKTCPLSYAMLWLHISIEMKHSAVSENEGGQEVLPADSRFFILYYKEQTPGGK